MKRIAFSLLICLSYVAQAQEYTFKPQWKKGQGKHITTVTYEKEWREGKIVKDTSTFMNADLVIKSVTAEYYEIEVEYKDFILLKFQEIANKSDLGNTQSHSLKLIYHVTKDGKKYDLINWEEAAQIFQSTIEELSNNLAEKTDSSKSKDFINTIFSSLSPLWNSKSAMEAQFKTEIEALTRVFQSSYSKTDTVTTIGTEANPFAQDKNDSLSATLYSWIEQNNAQNIIIGQKMEIDIEEFVVMMKQMMEKMIGGIMKMGIKMTESDTTLTSQEKQAKIDKINGKIKEVVDGINFDIQASSTIDFNKKTSFPNSVKSFMTFKGTMKKESRKTRREVIIEFK